MFGIYHIIRLIISLMLNLIIIYITKKSEKLKKYNNRNMISTLTLISIFVIGSWLSLFDVESSFIFFKTPESAFRYSNGFKKIFLTLNGEKSTLVILNDGTADIVPKRGDNTWGIRKKPFVGTGYTTKYSNGIIITTYTYENEYYVQISIENKDKIKLYDNKNTLFILKENSSKSIVSYYGYIKDYDTDYYITINGETFQLYF